MSCEKGNKFIDGSSGKEITSECAHTYETKQCQCFAKSDTELPHEDQFCGFEQDGFIFPCDVGCCKKGCPGQCPGIEPRPPVDIIGNLKIINNEDKEIQKLIATILIIIFVLVISSTITLFIPCKKKT